MIALCKTLNGYTFQKVFCHAARIRNSEPNKFTTRAESQKVYDIHQNIFQQCSEKFVHLFLKEIEW